MIIVISAATFIVGFIVGAMAALSTNANDSNEINKK